MAEEERLPEDQRNRYSGDPNNPTHTPVGTSQTQDRLSRYAQGGSRTFSLSGDKKIAGGQITGLERAQNLYGMNVGEIGDETSDIVRRRREALEGTDPAMTRLRQSRNRRLRMAKAEGASPEQLKQIEREAESDIAGAEYSSQEQALNQYQKLIGNIIGGTSSLEMGFAGLEKSGDTGGYTPYKSNNAFGTVICTELHNQGYMSDDIYKKDQDYGKHLRLSNPDVYSGYIFLAMPVVRLMRTSKLFTWIMSFPAMAWANNMAGNSNLFGKLISKIGEPLCGLVGSTVRGLNEKNKSHNA